MITLELLQNCVDNKESLFRVIECKNYKLIVYKYQFLSKFDIKVINLSGKHVMDWYMNLGVFDTYNMIQELIAQENL